MSDIKLFHYDDSTASELPVQSAPVEKWLQNLIESNMETFLGVRFLATEYRTSKSHRGRIDSLGIDENNCPVIVEYKRHVNENVINQGLFYLDWLMEHQADFQLLVMESLGEDVAKEIDWGAPRLLCIAGDFTKYDEYAVQQINRNIELLRYSLFEGDFLMLELINAVEKNGSKAAKPVPSAREDAVDDGEPYYLKKSDENLRSIYEAIKDYCFSLGDDVQEKHLKNYVAFKRLKNFLCIGFAYAGKDICLLVFLKLNPDEVELEKGFSRDMRGIGHMGTGDLEVRLRSLEDLDRIKPLIEKSYQNS